MWINIITFHRDWTRSEYLEPKMENPSVVSKRSSWFCSFIHHQTQDVSLRCGRDKLSFASWSLKRPRIQRSTESSYCDLCCAAWIVKALSEPDLNICSLRQTHLYSPSWRGKGDREPQLGYFPSPRPCLSGDWSRHALKSTKDFVAGNFWNNNGSMVTWTKTKPHHRPLL